MFDATAPGAETRVMGPGMLDVGGWPQNQRLRIIEAEGYLAARTGCYEMRCERYDAALEAMYAVGLDDSCTVFDVGAGMGEFGARMHRGGADVPRRHIPYSRARYVPVDAAIDGTDLEHWRPPRRAEWFVCLEVLEHLTAPARLLTEMIANATRGVVVSTPNPLTTDVLGMDATHRTPITAALLESAGLRVEARSFYGKPDDSLFGVWSGVTDDQHRTIGLALGFPECCVEEWVRDTKGGQGIRRGGKTARVRSPAEGAALDALVSAYLGRPWQGCALDPRVHYVPCSTCAGA